MGTDAAHAGEDRAVDEAEADPVGPPRPWARVVVLVAHAPAFSTVERWMALHAGEASERLPTAAPTWSGMTAPLHPGARLELYGGAETTDGAPLRLVSWGVAPTDLEAARTALAEVGIALQRVPDRPEHLLASEDRTPLLPLLVTEPAAPPSAIGGLQLLRFTVACPRNSTLARAVAALGAAVDLDHGGGTRLTAELHTQAGPITLRSR